MVVDIEVEGEVKGDSEERELDYLDEKMATQNQLNQLPIMDGKHDLAMAHGKVVKTGNGKFIEDNSEQMYKNSGELIQKTGLS